MNRVQFLFLIVALEFMSSGVTHAWGGTLKNLVERINSAGSSELAEDALKEIRETNWTSELTKKKGAAESRLEFLSLFSFVSRKARFGAVPQTFQKIKEEILSQARTSEFMNDPLFQEATLDEIERRTKEDLIVGADLLELLLTVKRQYQGDRFLKIFRSIRAVLKLYDGSLGVAYSWVDQEESQVLARLDFIVQKPPETTPFQTYLDRIAAVKEDAEVKALGRDLFEESHLAIWHGRLTRGKSSSKASQAQADSQAQQDFLRLYGDISERCRAGRFVESYQEIRATLLEKARELQLLDSYPLQKMLLTRVFNVLKPDPLMGLDFFALLMTSSIQYHRKELGIALMLFQKELREALAKDSAALLERYPWLDPKYPLQVEFRIPSSHARSPRSPRASRAKPPRQEVEPEDEESMEDENWWKRGRPKEELEPASSVLPFRSEPFESERYFVSKSLPDLFGRLQKDLSNSDPAMVESAVALLGQYATFSPEWRTDLLELARNQKNTVSTRQLAVSALAAILEPRRALEGLLQVTKDPGKRGDKIRLKALDMARRWFALNTGSNPRSGPYAFALERLQWAITQEGQVFVEAWKAAALDRYAAGVQDGSAEASAWRAVERAIRVQLFGSRRRDWDGNGEKISAAAASASVASDRLESAKRLDATIRRLEELPRGKNQEALRSFLMIVEETFFQNSFSIAALLEKWDLLLDSPSLNFGSAIPRSSGGACARLFGG